MAASIRLTYLAALSLCGISAAYAQDMRHVVQPHIPSSCVVLRARLSAPHGVLSPAAERRLDTDRIQRAMDHCAAGQAVDLEAEDRKSTRLNSSHH